MVKIFKKIFVLFLLIFSGVIILGACAQQAGEVIALHRLEYNPEKAEIEIYYFPSQQEAENYFDNREVDDYFLFETIGEDQEVDVVFEELPGELVEDNKRHVEFRANDNQTAQEKVVGLIDDNTLRRVHGPEGL